MAAAERLPRTVEVCGQNLKVRRPAKVKTDDGDDAFATYSLQSMSIEVERGLPATRAMWALKHEMAHASFDLVGADHRLVELAPDMDEDTRTKFEEFLIRTWLPAYEAAVSKLK